MSDSFSSHCVLVCFSEEHMRQKRRKFGASGEDGSAMDTEDSKSGAEESASKK